MVELMKLPNEAAEPTEQDLGQDLPARDHSRIPSLLRFLSRTRPSPADLRNALLGVCLLGGFAVLLAQTTARMEAAAVTMTSELVETREQIMFILRPSARLVAGITGKQPAPNQTKQEQLIRPPKRQKPALLQEPLREVDPVESWTFERSLPEWAGGEKSVQVLPIVRR